MLVVAEAWRWQREPGGSEQGAPTDAASTVGGGEWGDEH